jgi:hypothetical protein
VTSYAGSPFDALTLAHGKARLRGASPYLSRTPCLNLPICRSTYGVSPELGYALLSFWGFAPKGLKNLAPGFNPISANLLELPSRRCSLEQSIEDEDD